jgi:imidazolonepropionase-like amidohydrolase/Tol biopolymer transport system component
MSRLYILLVVIMVGCEDGISFGQYLPIKAARTVAFTTSEGSYMNLDVSPDGKTLLFDLLGDLYSVPANGGRAIELTRGIALHLRPVWSPNGAKIAYMSDTLGVFHLVVMSPAGSHLHVLGRSDGEVFYGLDPIWAPDNKAVGVGDVLYSLKWGKVLPGLRVKHLLRFSEDGKTAYGVDSGRIYSYDQNSNKKTAISPLLRWFRYGVLSADAHWWCYIADSNGHESLILQDLKTDSSKLLIPAMIEGDSRYRPAVPSGRFVFSPDSRSIFVSYGGKIHRIDVGSGVDRVIPFEANVKSDLGPYDYNRFRILHDSVKVRYTRSANASPDGRHLAFYALGKVYVMTVSTGSVRVAAAQPMRQFQPVYSPDGRWIAYVSWSDAAGGFLWRVPENGGTPEKLTHMPGQYQRPCWSPDGRFVAVVRGAPRLGDRDDTGVGALVLVPVGGGAERTIADSVPLWNRLTFSPDGRRIFYTPKYTLWSQKGSRIAQLVSMDLYGNGLKIVAVGAEFTVFQDKVVSPDGRFVVFSAGEDLYLVPAGDTTKPVVISDENGRIPGIRVAPGVDPYWEQGGKMLAWSYANRFYSISPDKIVISTKWEKEKTDSSGDFIVSTVKPNREIAMNLAVPYFYAQGTIALRDVRIITMNGDKVIEHGTIVVRSGRIISVGNLRAVQIPLDAKQIDLQGATVMPGLVDVHLHMRVPSNIFPEQSWMFLVNLAYGVTTARDPSLSFDSFGYNELLESGEMTGPRLFTVGRAVRLGDEVIRISSLSDAQAIVDKRAILGGTTIKQYTLPTRLQRELLLVASRRAGLNMTNEGADAPIFQLGMIKDGSTGVEHNPIWGDVFKDVVTFVASSRIFFTPTLQVSYGVEEGKEYFKYKYWREPNEKLKRFTYSNPEGGPTTNGAESLEAIMHANPQDTLNPGFLAPAKIDARILHAGGRICLGSHGNDEGIGPHNEIWALKMGGLSNMEALRAATLIGAEAIGVQRDIGSIEVGKLADLVILNRNPLEDIHYTREIRYVMKDGILYDGNTLETIWPMDKRRSPWILINEKRVSASRANPPFRK